ncbi:MAG: glycosyltransferase family 10, partial [Candidatus Omnitrophica bacterium]|nr:glycosyltransferase family 10 [Candidatus Omnitrophota bacterium]
VKKEKIKVFFSDFWENFDLQNNVFIDALKNDFEVEVSSDNPDILFYSWLSDNYKYFNCIRIYYTPEPRKPRYKECDFSLSFEYWDDPRNLRFPNYLLYGFRDEQFKKSNIDPYKLLEQKTGFCCTLISNPNSQKRIEFFHRLSKYKKVDSGGRVLNNIGGSVENKIDFIRRYKFNIAFENCQSPGYTTEKIVESMAHNVMPIYWGNPLIHYEFNVKSFFNYDDYDSEEELIEDIIAHDKDPQKYIEKFKQPWFEGGFSSQYFDIQRLRKFLFDIIKRRHKFIPIAKNKFKKYFWFPVGYQVNMVRGGIRKFIGK